MIIEVESSSGCMRFVCLAIPRKDYSEVEVNRIVVNKNLISIRFNVFHLIF